MNNAARTQESKKSSFKEALQNAEAKSSAREIQAREVLRRVLATAPRNNPGLSIEPHYVLADSVRKRELVGLWV